MSVPYYFKIWFTHSFICVYLVRWNVNKPLSPLQVQRPSKRARDTDSLGDRKQGISADKRQLTSNNSFRNSSTNDTNNDIDNSKVATAHLDPDVAEAEAFKTALLGAIMHSMQPPGGHSNAATPVGQGGSGRSGQQPGSRHTSLSEGSRGAGSGSSRGHHAEASGGSRSLKKQGSGGVSARMDRD